MTDNNEINEVWLAVLTCKCHHKQCRGQKCKIGRLMTLPTVYSLP